MFKLSPAIAIEFFKLQRAQWASPEKLEELQRRRLKKIINFAYENTKFYRERFRAAGITPEDIKDKDDLTKIPITSREDLQNADLLISSPYRKEDLKYSMTSGSSGRRTTTFFDAPGWIKAKILLKLRARLACGLKPFDKIAVFSELTAKNSFAKEFLLRQKFFSILDDHEAHYSQLEEFRPSAMYGFPSAFANLADHKVKINPTQIFTSSELLDPFTREKIEKSFDSSVFDVYGSTEVKEISWECPEHKGYHINSDWLVVEFISESRSCLDGSGSIVVTSLYNYGMPLIRYEIGDTGNPLPGRCPCGRGLPLMAPTQGRNVDYFILPNGTYISPYKMTCAIEKVDGMKQYQIRQESKENIVVSVVPQNSFRDCNTCEIISALENILPGLNIEVRKVDHIEKEKSGKYKIVVSDVSR